MFQLLPVFLGLFDSTVQKLMNGFRDIFYELAYSNLSNMLSDLNEKVATISTELSTAPDAWQGGTIWELIVKIAEQVALPVAGTVFTFVVLWELISMLVQPNNLADIDFVYNINNLPVCYSYATYDVNRGLSGRPGSPFLLKFYRM